MNKFTGLLVALFLVVSANGVDVTPATLSFLKPKPTTLPEIAPEATEELSTPEELPLSEEISIPEELPLSEELSIPVETLEDIITQIPAEDTAERSVEEVIEEIPERNLSFKNKHGTQGYSGPYNQLPQQQQQQQNSKQVIVLAPNFNGKSPYNNAVPYMAPHGGSGYYPVASYHPRYLKKKDKAGKKHYATTSFEKSKVLKPVKYEPVHTSYKGKEVHYVHKPTVTHTPSKKTAYIPKKTAYIPKKTVHTPKKTAYIPKKTVVHTPKKESLINTAPGKTGNLHNSFSHSESAEGLFKPLPVMTDWISSRKQGNLKPVSKNAADVSFTSEDSYHGYNKELTAEWEEMDMYEPIAYERHLGKKNKGYGKKGKSKSFTKSGKKDFSKKNFSKKDFSKKEFTKVPKVSKSKGKDKKSYNVSEDYHYIGKKGH